MGGHNKRVPTIAEILKYFPKRKPPEDHWTVLKPKKLPFREFYRKCYFITGKYYGFKSWKSVANHAVIFFGLWCAFYNVAIFFAPTVNSIIQGTKKRLICML